MITVSLKCAFHPSITSWCALHINFRLLVCINCCTTSLPNRYPAPRGLTPHPCVSVQQRNNNVTKFFHNNNNVSMPAKHFHGKYRTRYINFSIQCSYDQIIMHRICGQLSPLSQVTFHNDSWDFVNDMARLSAEQTQLVCWDICNRPPFPINVVIVTDAHDLSQTFQHMMWHYMTTFLLEYLPSGSDHSRSHIGPSWGTSCFLSIPLIWSNVFIDGDNPPCTQNIYISKHNNY